MRVCCLGVVLWLVLSEASLTESTSSYVSLKDTSKKYLYKERKKPFLAKNKKHKDTEEFAKRLEYDVGLKNAENSLDFGLFPIDLNLLQDEEFATDVIEGVDDELATIDYEAGDIKEEEPKNETNQEKPVTISLMHQGMYIPSSEYNSLIDGLVNNLKRDIMRRDMDPLYFNIHNRGIVRHTRPGEHPFQGDDPKNATTKSKEGDRQNTASTRPLGVGIIRGLKKVKRFGNAESRRDGNVTLVRSHFFFGPLNIGLIFGSTKGIRFINTTLSSLAAHALILVSNGDNSKSLKEFIMDSPMEYEITLRGAKSRRLRSLSSASITRLFKRGGRMERRLERSFRRGLRKPIREVGPKSPKVSNKGKEKKTRGERPKL